MRKLILGCLFALLAHSANAQSLNDKYLISQDPTFQQRVQMALITGAISILNESTATAQHTNRVALAVAVLTDTTGAWVRHFAFVVAQDATIASQATQNGSVSLVQNVTTCNSATPPVCNTTGNQSAQAAMSTDAAINNALAANANVFFQH